MTTFFEKYLMLVYILCYCIHYSKAVLLSDVKNEVLKGTEVEEFHGAKLRSGYRHFKHGEKRFIVKRASYLNNDSTLNEVSLIMGYMTGSDRKPGDLEYSRPGLTLSGGITYALHELKKDPFFHPSTGVNIILKVSETFGDEDISIKQVAELWNESNVSVIIGPQESCLYEGRLAASLNIPMLSYFCSDERTSDKNKFPTFSRTRPPDAAISRAVASLVIQFKWINSITIIYSDSSDDKRFQRVSNSLVILLKNMGVSIHSEISYKGPYHHGYGDNPFFSIVQNTKDSTRIYIIIGEYFEHLGLVFALKHHQLVDSGDYVVIGVSMDDYKEDKWNPHRYFRGLLRDESEKDAPEAFRSYLGIVASPPKNYTQFSKHVNYFMEREPFNYPNPLMKIGGFKKIRIEAAYLYDAVMLYGRAAKQLISSDLIWNNHTNSFQILTSKNHIVNKLSNGLLISQQLRNISYFSATGHESKMDEHGDAEGNFTLVSLKLKNSKFGLYPVGFFKRSSSELPNLTLTDKIDWVGGEPPVSEPECGFYGEKCKKDRTLLIVGGVASLFIILSLGGVYLLFRHWRLSRDMDALLWRIDKKDLQWDTENTLPIIENRLPGCSGSQSSLTKFSTLFAPQVTYRERHFAAKLLNISTIDHQVKIQLKLLRDLRHENLNAFIGACVHDDGLLLVTEYCSRGSIKDILNNGDLKLDDMFVSSLVGDLLRGLSYIHESSQIRFHGNMKSTNCLIDSRWNLKLCDFGLKFYEYGLKKGSDVTLAATQNYNTTPGSCQNENQTGTSTPFTRQSFTLPTFHHHTFHHFGGTQGNSLRATGVITSPYLPPEYPLLVQGGTKRDIEGHKRGDIYSLGVILWELLRQESLSQFLGIKEEEKIRKEILEGGHLTTGHHEETIHGVPCHSTFWPKALAFLNEADKNGNKNEICPYPPQILECLRDCLRFESELRPDIKTVKYRLRPLHKGMRSNIFDIMIGLMEKYANNLEILVDERTKQLSEEKRKTESLLYELIPPSVAEELKDGQKVAAQNYECVSIYFSDIVGFTSMSAQSTALQVVEFLNDLYTCFDSIIESFDVYKVETIGDAYMVASGLPVVKPGNYHAVEMAKMALNLLQAVENFQIKHRPTETIKLRIGIHSGPVCAGVVGLKRPRYCLFGDTVNTASRMESTGQPLRIHCSQEFANLIEGSDDEKFHLEERGLIDVKGKGDMMTFWLVGITSHSPEKGSDDQLPSHVEKTNKLVKVDNSTSSLTSTALSLSSLTVEA